MSPATSNTGLRAAYDREAAQYDRRRYESAEGRHFSQMEVELLTSWLPTGAGTTVLDIPAGTGRLSVALAQSGLRVIGADISANMLRVAASKVDVAAAGRPQFMQGSGTELPFADDTFDAVISFKFFHLIPNEQKPLFIREMARVLKPGHRMVVEFNSPYYGGIMAWLRYNFRKKQAGGMRMKCIFPDQIPGLFQGLRVTRTQGVKLPFSSGARRVFGWRAVTALERAFGRIPGLKYLAYAVIVEAEKPAATNG
jgi:ubiquinone/menaquinone biosynthesis C-methylase UbiE